MNMNKNIKRPFESAQIEVVDIIGPDVLTVSGFWGDEEDFENTEKLYWEQ